MDDIAIHEKLDKSKKIRSRIWSQGLRFLKIEPC